MLLLAVWAFRQWMNGEIYVSGNPLYSPMAAFLALVLAQWVFGTTAYRHVTYSHLLLYAAYGMLAFVVTQTLRRSSQFELHGPAIHGLRSGSGFVCGAARVGAEWKALLDPGRWKQGGAIYGPYVNHNHYAGLMEIAHALPAGAGRNSLYGREPQDCGGGNRRADGRQYFSFRFARRHGGVRGADGGADRASGPQARRQVGSSPSCWERFWRW